MKVTLMKVVKQCVFRPRCSQRNGSSSQRNWIISELAPLPFFLTVSITTRALSLLFPVSFTDSLSELVIIFFYNSLSNKPLRTGSEIQLMKRLGMFFSLSFGGGLRAGCSHNLFVADGQQTSLSQTMRGLLVSVRNSSISDWWLFKCDKCAKIKVRNGANTFSQHCIFWTFLHAILTCCIGDVYIFEFSHYNYCKTTETELIEDTVAEKDVSTQKGWGS